MLGFCIRGYAFSRSSLIFSALLLLLFLWAKQQVLDGDPAWFISAGQKIFSGVSGADEFWDTNPPYNFLFYVPVAAIIETGAFSPAFTVAVFHIAVILLNAAVILRIFSAKTLPSDETKWIVTSAYIAASLLFLISGHKDSLVAAALLAIAIFQYAIDRRLQTGSVLIGVALCVDALIIFLKPHFLIVPGALIAYRIIKNRNLKPLIECDHLVFMALGLLYITLTMIFFHGFVFERIPIILHLYASIPYEFGPIGQQFLFYMTINAVFLCAALFSKKSELSRLALLLACVTPLTLFVYFMQCKGFGEHLLPFNTFLIMIAFLIAAHHVHAARPVLGRFLAAGLILWACAYHTIAAPKDARAALDDFQSVLRVQAGEKSFFIEDTYATMPYITEIEMGNRHASYFPSIWMLSGFIAHGYSTDSECPEICGVFSDALLDGFEEYDPYILFLYQDDDIVDLIPTMSILKFLKDNKRFQEFMSHYTQTGDVLTLPYKTGQRTYLIYTKADRG